MLFRKRQRPTDPRLPVAAAVAAGKRRPRTAEERKLAMQFLQLLHRGADLRRGKVHRLRRSIEQGSYENDLKLKIAADRLFEDE